jgi:hypothetical protein
LAVVATLAFGAAGYAFWTQGGSGSGSGAVDTTLAITVNQTGSATGLYPGGAPVALAGTFTNPNASPASISSVTAVVRAFASHTVDATKPDCTEADFAIGGASGATVVPPGTGGSWSGLSVRMLDNGLNQDNCKGAPITIDYTASA